MFNRKISFGISWSLIGCTAIFCFYLVQLFIIVNDNVLMNEAMASNTGSLSEPIISADKPSKTNNLNPVNHMVTLKTNYGDVTIELFEDLAPKTVANFEKLAKDGFYNGTKFHRVIKDFMIQGGDPLSKDDLQKNLWGTGGPGYQFNDEINSEKIVRGVLAMANSGANTNGSQFFIVTASAAPWLDGKHTVFGKVVMGMDVVLKIEKVPTFMPGAVDRPLDNVIIEAATIR